MSDAPYVYYQHNAVSDLMHHICTPNIYNANIMPNVISINTGTVTCF